MNDTEYSVLINRALDSVEQGLIAADKLVSFYGKCITLGRSVLADKDSRETLVEATSEVVHVTVRNFFTVVTYMKHKHATEILDIKESYNKEFKKSA